MPSRSNSSSVIQRAARGLQKPGSDQEQDQDGKDWLTVPTISQLFVQFWNQILKNSEDEVLTFTGHRLLFQYEFQVYVQGDS
ncbi:hypothetical protein JOB18_030568 [Solea senegalensis]|uniref:Uncharacterized protein n=1 Tax=Solea senegalensis TaxID=28829 RepID=A0AAV6QXG7_SOLSE|nr:hypothetical protein JOB18_030568 [Solea senegalensis]